MNIEVVKVGELKTNCYIVKDKNEAIIIDPGFEIEKILPHLKNLKINAIILTHGHYDHVTDAFKLKEKVNAPVMMNFEDEYMMVLSTNIKANKHLEDKAVIKVGDLEFKVIHTPGHSKGGICLYNEKEKILFSGDTIFHGTYGRVDLPGSSKIDMITSLKKLLSLPKDVKVFPGHGPATTIQDEKNLLI